MNKNLNDIDKNLRKIGDSFEVRAPKELRNNVIKTLNNLPDRKCKTIRFKNLKIAGLTAGILLSTITLGAIFPSYAEAIPLIGGTFKSINEKLGVGEEYVKGAKGVKLSKTYDGITMTIKDIYYDGVEIAIAYELKNENEFSEKKPGIFPIIKYKERYIDYRTEENEGEFIDKNTYVGIASYNTISENLPEKVKIDFIVNDLYGNWVGEKPERFNFKLNLDIGDMERKIHPIDKEIDYEKSKFTVKDVIFSKLNTIINYDIYSPKRESGLWSNDILLFAIDDKGMPIETKGAGSKVDNNNNNIAKGNGETILGKVDSDAKSLTIVPVICKGVENYESVEIDKNLSFNEKTFIETENGIKYDLSPMEVLEDKIILKGTLKGKCLMSKDALDLYFKKKVKDNQFEHLESKINLESFSEEEGYKFTVELPKINDKSEMIVEILYNEHETILENEKIKINLTDIK